MLSCQIFIVFSYGIKPVWIGLFDVGSKSISSTTLPCNEASGRGHIKMGDFVWPNWRTFFEWTNYTTNYTCYREKSGSHSDANYSTGDSLIWGHVSTMYAPIEINKTKCEKSPSANFFYSPPFRFHVSRSSLPLFDPLLFSWFLVVDISIDHIFCYAFSSDVYIQFSPVCHMFWWFI